MFRDSDHPEAFNEQHYRQSFAQSRLEAWFSAPRMARYSGSSDPESLYVWNTRISKAFMEDVEHLEVLLRNFISDRLSADCGKSNWYDENKRYLFSNQFQSSVKKAKNRLLKQGKVVTPDGVVAELTLDSWRFLLVQRRQGQIWKALINKKNGGMPNYPGLNRADFEDDVETVRQLRNRAAHQQPFVVGPVPTIKEAENLRKYQGAISRVASRIDPEAEKWISRHSRVDELLRQRPQ